MISVVVLAAGASTRFGGIKQLGPVRGKTLLQHVVDTAAATGLGEIVIVLGHEADAIASALDLPPRARTVLNPRYTEGQSTSLGVGLVACDPSSEAAVILLGDQPGISVEHVRALADAFGERGGEIVRLRFRDAPGPALLARSVWPEVAALTGDTGARTLAEAQPERVRWIDVDAEAPTDVDHPVDLDDA